MDPVGKIHTERGILDIHTVQKMGTGVLDRGLRCVGMSDHYISLRWQAQRLPFPPPPKSAARNAVIRFMGVWLKNRISEGYSVALFHPIDLKFGMYTRLGVLDSRLKFQVSISSRTGVTGGSHLLKIQCNTRARTRIGETLFYK